MHVLQNLGYRPYYERWVRTRLGDSIEIPEEKQPAAEFLLALYDRYVPRCIDLILSGKRCCVAWCGVVVWCGVVWWRLFYCSAIPYCFSIMSLRDQFSSFLPSILRSFLPSFLSSLHTAFIPFSFPSFVKSTPNHPFTLLPFINFILFLFYISFSSVTFSSFYSLLLQIVQGWWTEKWDRN